MTGLLDAALELAAFGWPIHPLRGKDPRTAHGFRDATLDETTVRAWWHRWPDANVAIAVPDGMLVIDIDPRAGGEDTLAALEAEHSPLPPTLTTMTGAGGRHLWFKTPTNGLLQRDLGPRSGLGVQTRVGGKGYVVAPPSIHPETGRRYEWVEPLAPVAWLPGWVRTALLPPAPCHHQPPRLIVLDGHGERFLAWAADRVRSAPEGSRHETLRNTARLAGGYVASGLIAEQEARQVLREACSGWGSRHKDEKTIDSALENGRGAPLEAS